MKLFSRRWFFITCIFYILLSWCLLIHSTDPVLAKEQNPVMVSSTPEKKSATCFRLVDSHVIEARLLDDQMLEDVSPSLIAPVPVKISQYEYNQIIRQEFHNSVCFKRCHSKNDFSASDNTEKQWRLLIENDGHTVFSKIPWQSPQNKEKVLKYLINNAGHPEYAGQGIGVWH